MTDDEINKRLATAMGVEPEIVHIVTCDGGKSARANTSRDGKFETRDDLEDLLAQYRANGLWKDCVLGEWSRYPDYLSDPVASAQLEDWLQRWYDIQVDARRKTGSIRLREIVNGLRGDGKTIDFKISGSLSAARRRALALAAVRALAGKEEHAG